MTTVIFTTEDDRYMVEMTDHTDEIVCAGLSALIQAFAGYAMNADVKHYDFQLRPGDSYVVCVGGDNIKHAFEMLKIGVKQIELGYPGTITIIDTFVGNGS